MTSVHSDAVPPIPAAVREFVARHLRSATELDALMLLHRARETFWKAAAIAAIVGAAETHIQQFLARLTAAGITERARETDAVRFDPPAALEEAVTELAGLYDTRRDDLLSVIRLAAVEAFAESFRFTRD